MRSLLPWALALGLLSGTLGLAATSQAQTPDPTLERARENARARFKKGSEAYSQGRYKDAIDLFLEADGIAPSAAFAWNIGVAYEKMGDAASALRWLREYLRRSPDAKDRADVESRVGKLERRLRERGVQQVTVLSTPPGATVELDGRPVGVTPWTGELAPGDHRAALRARGYADATQSFTLTADKSLDVDVKLTTEVAHAEPPPSAPAAPVVVAHRPRHVRPWTWAALGVGVAGLGTSLAFELLRASEESSAKSSPVQLDAAKHLDSEATDRTVARVMLGVGGGFLALGGVLLVVDLSSGGAKPAEAATAAGWRANLGCSPGHCEAALTGRF